VSQRLGLDRFLITPTAVSKRLCGSDTIVECDLAGKPVSRGKPPSEVQLHVCAYRSSRDVNAVIHAHPQHPSAFALARVDLGAIAMPEVVVSLGDQIPLVPFLLPKDPATGDAIARAVELADVALLAGNGVIAVGADLELAFLRIEVLEHYAKILAISRGGIGAPVALTHGERERLLEMRRAAGLMRSYAAQPAKDPSLRNVVAEEVRRALGVDK
jgi:L-fuculose-phosphate aldolase